MTSIRRTQLATEILCEAFAMDPGLEWLFPESVAARRVSSARMFGSLAEESAAAGELAVLDEDAAAVWLPMAAGQKITPGPEVELPKRLRIMVDLLGHKHSSARQHLYLAFLGVLPSQQGRGLGGALLDERLRRADAEGLPVYLEASSKRNVPLYERHGFRSTGEEITLPDGPTLWPMWRECKN